MTNKRYSLVARVSTDSPDAIALVLRELIRVGTVTAAEDRNEFLVRATMTGESAKALNRALLSALRRVEKKTRLRAEWIGGGVHERFFDYVSKRTRKA